MILSLFQKLGTDDAHLGLKAVNLKICSVKTKYNKDSVNAHSFKVLF